MECFLIELGANKVDGLLLALTQLYKRPFNALSCCACSQLLLSCITGSTDSDGNFQWARPWALTLLQLPSMITWVDDFPLILEAYSSIDVCIEVICAMVGVPGRSKACHCCRRRRIAVRQHLSIGPCAFTAIDDLDDDSLPLVWLAKTTMFTVHQVKSGLPRIPT